MPGVDLLGASYKTFVLVPFLDYTRVSEAPAPKPTHGTFTQFGIANPLLQIVDLSWTLGDGFYVNAGFGVFLPIGQWNYPLTNYYSGEVLLLNATFMKLIGGFNFGPVGYLLKQVTNDANYGGPAVYGGLNAPLSEELAVGATISTQFGNLSVKLRFTQDIYARNSTYGSKGWLDVSYHFR